MATSTDTIMVVSDNAERAGSLLGHLFEAGFAALGPVPSARAALAIVAHGFPTLAIVADPPTGRRDAGALAETLMRNWGIHSLVLPAAWAGRPPVNDAAWRARPDQVRRLMPILESAKADIPE